MLTLDPERVRLTPGECVPGRFSSPSSHPGEIAFFIRPIVGTKPENGDLGLVHRAGIIKFDNVLLVLTMVKLEKVGGELYDLWWNYHSLDGLESFRQMADQERLSIHFYHGESQKFTFSTINGFRKFFSHLLPLIEKTRPWSDVDFDRAVRSCCAQNYPKENLWEMILIKAEPVVEYEEPLKGLESYSGRIPQDLKSYYVYTDESGHCIKVIPSTLEAQALLGRPEDCLYAAPVKTVLRCGTRWLNGLPVAPVPFIPGYGLAVPPDDIEF
jgi:hypothetical protein